MLHCGFARRLHAAEFRLLPAQPSPKVTNPRQESAAAKNTLFGLCRFFAGLHPNQYFYHPQS